MDARPEVDRRHPQEAIPLGPLTCLLLALAFCAAPMGSSLWLDETATVWVVRDGLGEVFRRSWLWSGQSPLYYSLAWLSKGLGGEIGLRLPSYLSTLLAAWVLFRLGRRLFGTSAGVVAALAFVCVPEVSFAATDARPYALGLLLVTASMFFFVRTLETGRLVFAVGYVVSSSLVVYAHYLLALGLAPQLIYFVTVRRKDLMLSFAAIGVLCLPLAGQVLEFYGTRQQHSWAQTPGIYALCAALAPPVLAAPVAIAALMSGRNEQPVGERYIGLLTAWLVLPPLILFAVSVFSETKLFVPRYYLASAPAAALLAGYVLQRFSANRLGSGLLFLVFVIGFWQQGPRHGNHGWREAAEALNKQTTADDVVLIPSGFVEATEKKLNDPAIREVLFAPQLVYPVAQMRRMSFTPSEAGLAKQTQGVKGRIYLVTVRVSENAEAYEKLLEKTLSGYCPTDGGDFGLVRVTKFDKACGTPGP